MAQVELRFGRRPTKKSHRNYLESGTLSLKGSCAEVRGSLSTASSDLRAPTVPDSKEGLRARVPD